MGENIVFLKGFHEWVKGVQTFCVYRLFVFPFKLVSCFHESISCCFTVDNCER